MSAVLTPTSTLSPRTSSSSVRHSVPTVSDHRALRFLTAGSVDDGKSTLIGRLLYDSQAILADQLDTLEKRAAGEPIDLSLLTDGLEAEREQGITIDVAYRYFATKSRKFIIADCPGHVQYTGNMATGASTADLALVVLDVASGQWATIRCCAPVAVSGPSSACQSRW